MSEFHHGWLDIVPEVIDFWLAGVWGWDEMAEYYR